jgi:hypothetical protein
MKRFFIGLFTLGFVITVSTNVFAQTEEKKGTEGKRVIEEKILLKDPTVAEPKKWLIGVSGEYWYVTGPYNTYNSANQKITEGNIKGDMPGGILLLDMTNLRFSILIERASLELIAHTWVQVLKLMKNKTKQNMRQPFVTYFPRISQ